MFKTDHMALRVKDLGQSRAFYEALGGRVVSKPSEVFLEIVLGELRLHLIRAQAGQTDPGAAPRSASASQSGIDHLCVAVDGFHELLEAAEIVNAHPGLPGAPFSITTSPPLGPDAGHCEQRPPLHVLYCNDPDGITIEIRAYSDS